MSRMATNSANWRMANRLAGGSLDGELAEMVSAGVSMRRIGVLLFERYGIEATGPTIRAWVDDLTKGEAA